MQHNIASLDDRMRLVELIRTSGDRGMVISDAISKLEQQSGDPTEFVKHVIRQAIDRGEVKTDSHFRLHVGRLKKYA